VIAVGYGGKYRRTNEGEMRMAIKKQQKINSVKD